MLPCSLHLCNYLSRQGSEAIMAARTPGTPVPLPVWAGMCAWEICSDCLSLQACGNEHLRRQFIMLQHDDNRLQSLGIQKPDRQTLVQFCTKSSLPSHVLLTWTKVRCLCCCSQSCLLKVKMSGLGNHQPCFKSTQRAVASQRQPAPVAQPTACLYCCSRNLQSLTLSAEIPSRYLVSLSQVGCAAHTHCIAML